VLYSPSKPDVPASVEEALGPALLELLGRLRLHSRRIFAGKLPGERRSKKRGQSVEFDDFREYVRGDDLRHIDWNVYARLEKLFLKLFLEDEDLALHVAVDRSASMDAGRPPKAALAARLGLAIALVGLRNQDRVSVWTINAPGAARPLEGTPPLRGRAAAGRVLDALFAPRPPGSPGPGGAAGPGRLGPALVRLARSRAGKGVVVVISDFLTDEDLTPALNALAFGGGGGFDTTLVRVLSPGEADPAAEADAGLVGDVLLTDVESAASAEVTITPDLIARYRRRLDAHQRALAAAATARGIGFVSLTSDADPAAVLTGSLRASGVVG